MFIFEIFVGLIVMDCFKMFLSFVFKVFCIKLSGNMKFIVSLIGSLLFKRLVILIVLMVM